MLDKKQHLVKMWFCIQWKEGVRKFWNLLFINTRKWKEDVYKFLKPTLQETYKREGCITRLSVYVLAFNVIRVWTSFCFLSFLQEWNSLIPLR